MPPPASTSSRFVIESDTQNPLRDAELRSLLDEVYVGGGFTDPDVARVAFVPATVRARGEISYIRSPTDTRLLGVVIFVDPSSPARRIASNEEAELHLLATSPQSRRLGIGRALVDAIIARAKRDGFARLVLWTQPSMRAAHRLYEAAGFVRNSSRDFHDRGREFLVLERGL